MRRVDTAAVMRKPLILLGLLALAAPVAGLSAQSSEGTLSVENGRGKVTLQVRGGVIGRLERGSVTFFDLTPEDLYDPWVFGDDEAVRFVGDTGITYSGSGLRFRLGGGGFRVVVTGRGIDLSAVGKGSGSIQGAAVDPGLYSVDGVDCRTSRGSCKPLPEIRRVFQLGTGDKSLISRSNGG